MSNILCTFSGKFGDILWSLPTAKKISELHNQKVDFYMMPYYQSLCDLLDQQSYIDKSGIFVDWLREHSNHGDQPWQPPIHYEHQYEKAYHLTYKGHPGINAPNMPLIDFIAHQQGVKLQDPVPFIEAPYFPTEDWLPEPVVVMSFNEQYKELKDEFVKEFLEKVMAHVSVKYMEKLPWTVAAHEAEKAVAFVGDRSANWVIANGVGQKNIITYEPHQARHASGGLGRVFGNPYWQEVPLPLNMPPAVCADAAASMVKKIIGC